MAAYVIVEIEVTDAAGYENYKTLAAASIAAYGGRFVVRGGEAQALEGGWEPKRIVVLEFPDRERARAWWASKAYAAARIVRERTARARMILVDGLARP
jgi:uncharacterized protein (DUF1330 family)